MLPPALRCSPSATCSRTQRRRFALSDKIVDAIVRARKEREQQGAAAAERLERARAEAAARAAAAGAAAAKEEAAAAARRLGHEADMEGMEEEVHGELAGGAGAGRTAAPEPPALEAVIVPMPVSEQARACGAVPIGWAAAWLCREACMRGHAPACAPRAATSSGVHDGR